jgi:hypothetical protein
MVNAGLIVKVNVAEAVRPRLSVTVKVMLGAPAELVVPLMAPEDAFRLMPGGNAPDVTAQV